MRNKRGIHTKRQILLIAYYNYCSIYSERVLVSS